MSDDDAEVEPRAFDRMVLQVFEEQEDKSGKLTYPLTSQRQALDFIKLINRKGFPYQHICEALGEKPQTFRSWRLGNGNASVGTAMMRRINKTVQEAMSLPDRGEEDVELEEDIDADGFLDDIDSDEDENADKLLSDDEKDAEDAATPAAEAVLQSTADDVDLKDPASASSTTVDVTTELESKSDGVLSPDSSPKSDVSKSATTEPSDVKVDDDASSNCVEHRDDKSGVEQVKLNVPASPASPTSSADTASESASRATDSVDKPADVKAEKDTAETSAASSNTSEAAASDGVTAAEISVKRVVVDDDVTDAPVVIGQVKKDSEQPPRVDTAVLSDITKAEKKSVSDELSKPASVKPAPVKDDGSTKSSTDLIEPPSPNTESKETAPAATDEASESTPATDSEEMKPIPKTDQGLGDKPIPAVDEIKNISPKTEQVTNESSPPVADVSNQSSVSSETQKTVEQPKEEPKEEPKVEYEASSRQLSLLSRLSMLKEKTAQRKAGDTNTSDVENTSSQSGSSSADKTPDRMSSVEKTVPEITRTKPIPPTVEKSSSPKSTRAEPLSQTAPSQDLHKTSSVEIGHSKIANRISCSDSKATPVCDDKSVARVITDSRPTAEVNKPPVDKPTETNDISTAAISVGVNNPPEKTVKPDSKLALKAVAKESSATEDKNSTRITPSSRSDTQINEKQGKQAASAEPKTNADTTVASVANSSTKETDKSKPDAVPSSPVTAKETAVSSEGQTKRVDVEQKMNVKAETACLKQTNLSDCKQPDKNQKLDKVENVQGNVVNAEPQTKTDKNVLQLKGAQVESQTNANVSLKTDDAKVEQQSNSKDCKVKDDQSKKDPQIDSSPKQGTNANNSIDNQTEPSDSKPSAAGQADNGQKPETKSDQATRVETCQSTSGVGKRVKTQGRRLELIFDSVFDASISDNYDSDLDIAGTTEKTYSLVDRVRRLKASPVEAPGYLYVFTDSPTDHEPTEPIGLMTSPRFKVGASRFPGKRLQQAKCFNPNMKPLIVASVKRRLEALKMARAKLDQFKINGCPDWFACDDDVIASVVDDVIKDIV